MSSCVIKNKDFYSLAEEHGVDGNELELIVHKYWNEVGREDSFPPSSYINEQLGIGKSYNESGENVRKLWDRDYSRPLKFKSEFELNGAVQKAKTFFPADAITTYKDNKGNFILRVAEPVVSSSVDREIQDILAKASRDEQGRLLAPNGKVSNLTEKQYAQVRTKAFKEWFGDWERIAVNNVNKASSKDIDFTMPQTEVPISDFLDRLERSSWSPIVSLIKSKISNIEEINLVYTQFKKGSTKGGIFNPTINTIYLDESLPGSEEARLGIHELLHAITSREFDLNEIFRSKIIELFKLYREHPTEGLKSSDMLNPYIAYSFSSPKEFMAEALNPNVARKLSKIPYKKSKNTSLWDKFKESILNIFGITKTHEYSLYDETLNTILTYAKLDSFDPNSVSKVVDENGEPLVVYHSTRADFSTFDLSKSKRGEGLWFKPWKDGSTIIGKIVEKLSHSHDIPVYLNIKNPVIVDKPSGYKSGDIYTRKGIDKHSTSNNDGAIGFSNMNIFKGTFNMNNIRGKNGIELVVFNPNQIKSATDNIGTFDANNPDIRYREATITPEDIQQYHKERLDYSNLDNTQKALLEDRGINEEHYSFLTQAEKENLRMCLI